MKLSTVLSLLVVCMLAISASACKRNVPQPPVATDPLANLTPDQKEEVRTSCRRMAISALARMQIEPGWESERTFERDCMVSVAILKDLRAARHVSKELAKLTKTTGKTIEALDKDLDSALRDMGLKP